jgi:hypothetical protein
VRQHLDYDAVIAYAEDLFNQDVYQNPEIYIEESERELSRKQEEDVKVREDKIQRLSEYISRLESDMDGEDDEEIQEKIDELQESIDEMEQEIEEIKEDPEGDFPDELIEEIISDRVREANNDIEGFMNEWGLEWNEYVDKDAFIKAVIDEDGYGHTLNGYDGSADEVTIQDELFYVMRID